MIYGMSAIILHRIDAVKNMRRFYRLDVQPDLFGQWCFIREWGRIGRAGQVRMVPTAADAQDALARQQRVKAPGVLRQDTPMVRRRCMIG
jgi:predicted DNA-binding WGR domain protein